MAERTERKVVPITDALPQWKEFCGALLQRMYLDGAIKDLDAEKDKQDETLLFIASAWQTELEEREPCLFQAEVDKEKADGEVLRVGVYQNRGRREIKAELLLQQGVTVEQIEKATVEGAMGKAYVRVTKAGKK